MGVVPCICTDQAAYLIQRLEQASLFFDIDLTSSTASGSAPLWRTLEDELTQRLQANGYSWPCSATPASIASADSSTSDTSF